MSPVYAGHTKTGAIYPPRPSAKSFRAVKTAWPERSSQPQLPPPAALTSAEATLKELDLTGWSFALDSSQCVGLSVQLSTLVRMLLAPSTDDQRKEWARRLVLVAQEQLPDAGTELKHLYTSLGRESWEVARQRKRREQLWSSAVGAATPKAAKSRREDRMEREEMAAELAHFTAVLRRAISRKEFASNKRATKDVLPPEPEVEAGGFAPDVLRAGKAHFTSVDEAGAAAAGAYDPFAASALGGAGTETAVRYCRPLWAVPEGGDGTRLQATLRFEPGVAHGDSVLVAGPDGEQLPLLTPPGVRNVCRILASVPAPSDSTGARAPEGTQGTGGLLVDVLPLGPNAAPQKRLGLDGGHELILPSYATPFTSLVFATPIHLGDGARRVPSGRKPPPRKKVGGAKELVGANAIFEQSEEEEEEEAPSSAVPQRAASPAEAEPAPSPAAMAVPSAMSATSPAAAQVEGRR